MDFLLGEFLYEIDLQVKAARSEESRVKFRQEIV
jgi:hypothetical protein